MLDVHTTTTTTPSPTTVETNQHPCSVYSQQKASPLKRLQRRYNHNQQTVMEVTPICSVQLPMVQCVHWITLERNKRNDTES